MTLACSLIGGISTLVLDEPSSGIDVVTKKKLFSVIKNHVQKNNAAIILTTHAMSEAEALCSNIGIIINGIIQC